MPRMDKLSPHHTMWTGDHDVGGVRYHTTDIVSWDRDVIILCTGGWKDVTTKRKMNQAARQFGLGYGVHQRKHCWYVSRWDAAASRWYDEQPFDGDVFVIVRKCKQVAA